MFSSTQVSQVSILAAAGAGAHRARHRFSPPALRRGPVTSQSRGTSHRAMTSQEEPTRGAAQLLASCLPPNHPPLPPLPCQEPPQAVAPLHPRPAPVQPSSLKLTHLARGRWQPARSRSWTRSRGVFGALLSRRAEPQSPDQALCIPCVLPPEARRKTSRQDRIVPCQTPLDHAYFRLGGSSGQLGPK